MKADEVRDRADQAPLPSRREFLKSSALVGGCAAVLNQLDWAQQTLARAEAGPLTPAEEYELAKLENTVSTVCLQCNTGCGMRVKILNGVAVKLEGNPYSPWTMVPSIPYKTPLTESARLAGALCPKGQAGLQTLYDPYRIVKVLKRAGRRGENRWKTIPFDQAVNEIVKGGRLFRHVPGEESRRIEGLAEIWALRDPKVASAMGAEIETIRSKKKPEEKAEAVAAFKRKFAEHMHVMIDPDHPDFGPRNNQFVFMWGRVKAGRGELIRRFAQDGLGSANAHGHTTVCQGSLYFTGKAMSDQFVEGKLTGGKKQYWQADTSNVEFLLAIGSAYIEGGYGPTHHARKLMKRLVDGKVKIAVVDPRYSKIASKAYKWIPALPGSEGAFVLGLTRWILENNGYDSRFVASANKAAATKAGESSWTNGTWLVKEDGTFLHASEIGLSAKEKRKTADGKEWEFDAYVALVGGQPAAVDPNDTERPVSGDLFVSTELGGIRVKSGLQMIRESAMSRTIEEWATICGIAPGDIVELASELTRHGKKAVVDCHRGVSQHTNGFYNVLAVNTLNALLGNYDWRGGSLWMSTYGIAGDKKDNPFPLDKMHPKKSKPFGLSVIRHEQKYEDSTLFAGYPAKRNWYPMASDIYQEIVPSIGDQYPYPVKILFTYMASPAYALPGGHTNIEVLADVGKIPLVVASDITIGETSMYADYIFPDLSFLERWEFHGTHPSIPQKVQPVRNPAVAPLTETVTVFGQPQPISLESMLLAFAERMGLPGFGEGGLGGNDFVRAEDYYLRMVANIAAGDGPTDSVPEATDEEMRLFRESRRHLPETVYDAARWRAIVGEKWWRRVVYVLNRGGRFQDYDAAYDGDKVRNRYGGLINLYVEKLAKLKHAVTGKRFAAVATYVPIADLNSQPIDDEAHGFDLNLITYRDIAHTKSRTAANYWLLAIAPSNALLLSPRDASRYGLKDGDRVRLVSRSNPEGVWDLKNGTKKPMEGAVRVTEGIRPGVVAFSLGHGHWAYGSSDVVIDGRTVRGDARRGGGLHGNAAMRLDDHVKNTCLVDPVGGSVSFYDTRVRLEKA